MTLPRKTGLLGKALIWTVILEQSDQGFNYTFTHSFVFLFVLEQKGKQSRRSYKLRSSLLPAIKLYEVQWANAVSQATPIQTYIFTFKALLDYIPHHYQNMPLGREMMVVTSFGNSFHHGFFIKDNELPLIVDVFYIAPK